jgi:cytochrome c oxidase subunit II
MNKGILIISMLAVVLIAGCSSGTQQQQTTNDGVPSGPPPSPSQDAQQAPATQSEVKEFDMIARQFVFEPAIVTVNEGDTVVLNLNNIDVQHGIAIPAFGVRADLPVGKTTRVEFVADRAGTYPFFCSVYCGSGHGSMSGEIIVEQK